MNTNMVKIWNSKCWLHRKCIFLSDNWLGFGLVLGYRGFWINLFIEIIPEWCYWPILRFYISHWKLLDIICTKYGFNILSSYCPITNIAIKTMSCAIIIRYCIHSYTNLAERHNGNESQLGSKKIIPTLFKLNSHSIQFNATT